MKHTPNCHYLASLSKQPVKYAGEIQIMAASTARTCRLKTAARPPKLTFQNGGDKTAGFVEVLAAAPNKLPGDNLAALGEESTAAPQLQGLSADLNSLSERQAVGSGLTETPHQPTAPKAETPSVPQGQALLQLIAEVKHEHRLAQQAEAQRQQVELAEKAAEEKRNRDAHLEHLREQGISQVVDGLHAPADITKTKVIREWDAKHVAVILDGSWEGQLDAASVTAARRAAFLALYQEYLLQREKRVRAVLQLVIKQRPRVLRPSTVSKASSTGTQSFNPVVSALDTTELLEICAHLLPESEMMQLIEAAADDVASYLKQSGQLEVPQSQLQVLAYQVANAVASREVDVCQAYHRMYHSEAVQRRIEVAALQAGAQDAEDHIRRLWINSPQKAKPASTPNLWQITHQHLEDLEQRTQAALQAQCMHLLDTTVADMPATLQAAETEAMPDAQVVPVWQPQLAPDTALPLGKTGFVSFGRVTMMRQDVATDTEVTENDKQLLGPFPRHAGLSGTNGFGIFGRLRKEADWRAQAVAKTKKHDQVVKMSVGKKQNQKLALAMDRFWRTQLITAICKWADAHLDLGMPMMAEKDCIQKAAIINNYNLLSTCSIKINAPENTELRHMRAMLDTHGIQVFDLFPMVSSRANMFFKDLLEHGEWSYTRLAFDRWNKYVPDPPVLRTAKVILESSTAQLAKASQSKTMSQSSSMPNTAGISQALTTVSMPDPNTTSTAGHPAAAAPSSKTAGNNTSNSNNSANDSTSVSFHLPIIELAQFSAALIHLVAQCLAIPGSTTSSKQPTPWLPANATVQLRLNPTTSKANLSSSSSDQSAPSQPASDTSARAGTPNPSPIEVRWLSSAASTHTHQSAAALNSPGPTLHVSTATATFLTNGTQTASSATSQAQSPQSALQLKYSEPHRLTQPQVQALMDILNDIAAQQPNLLQLPDEEATASLLQPPTAQVPILQRWAWLSLNVLGLFAVGAASALGYAWMSSRAQSVPIQNATYSTVAAQHSVDTANNSPQPGAAAELPGSWGALQAEQSLATLANGHHHHVPQPEQHMQQQAPKHEGGQHANLLLQPVNHLLSDEELQQLYATVKQLVQNKVWLHIPEPSTRSSSAPSQSSSDASVQGVIEADTSPSGSLHASTQETQGDPDSQGNEGIASITCMQDHSSSSTQTPDGNANSSSGAVAANANATALAANVPGTNSSNSSSSSSIPLKQPQLRYQVVISRQGDVLGCSPLDAASLAAYSDLPLSAMLKGADVHKKQEKHLSGLTADAIAAGKAQPGTFTTGLQPALQKQLPADGAVVLLLELQPLKDQQVVREYGWKLLGKHKAYYALADVHVRMWTDEDTLSMWRAGVPGSGSNSNTTNSGSLQEVVMKLKEGASIEELLQQPGLLSMLSKQSANGKQEVK